MSVRLPFRATLFAVSTIAILSVTPAGSATAPDPWVPFISRFQSTGIPVYLPDVARGFPAFQPPFRKTGSAEPSRLYPTIHATRDGYEVTLEQIPDRCDGAMACVQMTIEGSRKPADLSLTGRRVLLTGGVVAFLAPADISGHQSIVWQHGGVRYAIVNHGYGPKAAIAAANSALQHGPYRLAR